LPEPAKASSVAARIETRTSRSTAPSIRSISAVV
jgi:hypothetical protein